MVSSSCLHWCSHFSSTIPAFLETSSNSRRVSSRSALNQRALHSSYREGEKGYLDPEESPGKAGFVAGAGAGFHWMRLKTRRESSATEENLERAVKEVDDHRLRRAPARLPLATSLARRMLLLPAIEFFGSTSAGEGKFRLAKA
jgi:hypothetical protein